MSAGEVHHLELVERLEHVEDRADAAIVDVRGLAKQAREYHAETTRRLSNIEKVQAAQGRAMNVHFARLETKLDAALEKASGARRLAAETDKRVSEVEGDLTFQAAMATAKADGEELRAANVREWRRYSLQALKAVGGGTTVLAVLTFLFTRCGG